MKNKKSLLSLASLLLLLAGCDGNSAKPSTSIPSSQPVTTLPSASEAPIPSTSTAPVIVKYEASAQASEGVTITFNGQAKLEAEEGTEVTIALTYAEHYHFDSITSGDAELTTVEEGKTYTFVMPAKNVLVTINASRKSHAITVTASKGVTYTFGNNGATSLEAKYGEEVTLSLNYEENYEFDSITSDDVALTPITEGSKYTFTRPDKAVNISVVAKKINSNFSSYKILGKDLTDFKIAYGTAKAFEVTDESIKSTEIKVGTEVTFTAKLGGYYYSSYDVLLYVNDVEYKATANGSAFTGKFIRPSDPADLLLVQGAKEMEKGDDAFKATINASTDGSYKIYGIKDGGYYSKKDDNYAPLYFYVIYKDGYSVSATCTGFTSTQFGVDSRSDNVLTYKLTTYYFKGTESSITRTSTYKGVKSISFTDSDKFSVVGKTSYTPGEWVNLKITPNDGWKIDGFDSATIDGKKTELTKVPGKSIWEGSTNTLSFIMPDGGNVVLSRKLVEVKTLNFTLPEDGTVTEIKFGKYPTYSDYGKLTSGVPGTKVYVFPTLKDGYAISKMYYQEGKEVTYGRDSFGDSTYSFEIPADGKVNITCITTKLNKVTVDNTHTDQYSIKTDKPSYKQGDKVTVTVTAQLGFKVTNLTLDDESITDLTNDNDNPNKWTFTRGTKDVSITVVGKTVIVSTITIEDKNSGLLGKSIYDSKNSMVSSKKLNEGDTGYLYVSPKNGFTVSKVTLKFGETEQELHLITEGTFKNKYQFVAPAGNATIVVETVEEVKSTRSITGEADLKVSVHDISFGEPIHASADKTFSLYSEHKIKVTLNSGTNYYIDDKSQIALKADGEDIKFELDPNPNSHSANIVFTAPKESKNVTLTLAPKAYTRYKVTIASGCEKYIKVQAQSSFFSYADVDTNKDKIKEGTRIKVQYIGDDNRYTTEGRKYLVYRSAATNKLIRCYKFKYQTDYDIYNELSEDIIITVTKAEVTE